MKMDFLWLVLLALLAPQPVSASLPPLEKEDQITVYIFLHEACIISQYYTRPLRQMHEAYATENLQFVGLFPNPSSSPEKIEAFKEKYRVPFALETDHYHHKTDALGASVTPEVVVFNETRQQILYKGRIDDAYARVGKRKRVSASSELKDVLEALRLDLPVSVEHARAVGCYIGDNKLN